MSIEEFPYDFPNLIAEFIFEIAHPGSILLN